GRGVVVVLDQGFGQRDVFGQDIAVLVAVDLRRAREDQPEPFPALELEHVAGADHIGLPQRLEILLAVHPSEFGREAIDVLERLSETLFGLPVFGASGADVLRSGLMLQIRAPNLGAAARKLPHQRLAEGALRSGDESLGHGLSWTSLRTGRRVVQWPPEDRRR